MAHISDYEKLRLKNLADNKAMLQQIMGDSAKKECRLNLPQMKKRTRSVLDQDAAKNAVANAWYDPPLTRSRSASVSSSTMSSDVHGARGPGKLLVRIDLIAKRRRASVEEGGNDSESSDIVFYGEEDDDVASTDGAWNGSAATTRTPLPCHKIKTPILSKAPEDITEEDLANVASVVSDKTYNERGMTCHQCRQKTLDTKTICRSGRCTGTRGQFCGPCLRNRYGEDAREALRNPEWICPSCRGICNCSMCRRRAGKACTGILIHCARESGYDSVSSFLSGSKI